jgi:CubicO group peptidase (beta-lactamase class C family)
MNSPEGFGSVRQTPHVPGPSTRPTITLDSSLTRRQSRHGECSHTPEQYDAVVADMQERLEAEGFPGGALAIVCNGSLDFAAGVGVKRYDQPDPVTPDTLFRVWSDTKMVTATAIMSLVDEGRLDLNRPITDYLPWFAVQPPYDASDITMHLLLTHQGGLPQARDLLCDTGPDALENYFRESNPWTLWAPPGRYHNYSNLNYNLAGLVAKTVDERPFTDMIQARVYDPVGMTATFDPAVAREHGVATGHVVADGEVSRVWEPEEHDCGAFYPSGRSFASIVDYAHLAEVFLSDGGGVISPESNAAMQAHQVWTHINPDLYYGYGLWPTTYKGIEVLRHNGSGEGYSADFVMVPGTRDAVMVFLNGSDSIFPPSFSATTILNSALDILYDLGNIPPTDYRTDPSTWTPFEGTYYDPNRWGTIQVEVRDDRLWFDFMDLGWSGPATQTSDGWFVVNPAGRGNLNGVFHSEDGEPAEALLFYLPDGTTALRVP